MTADPRGRRCAAGDPTAQAAIAVRADHGLLSEITVLDHPLLRTDAREAHAVLIHPAVPDA